MLPVGTAAIASLEKRLCVKQAELVHVEVCSDLPAQVATRADATRTCMTR